MSPRIVASRIFGNMLLLSMVSQLADAQSHCPHEVVGHTNKGNEWNGHPIGERPVTGETTQTGGTTTGTVSGNAGTPAGGGGASVSTTSGSATTEKGTRCLT